MRVWSALSHINLVQFIGYFFHSKSATEGEAWLVSAWHEEGSVDGYLKRAQLAPLARERLLLVSRKDLDAMCMLTGHMTQLQDACDGLGYMHTLPQPVVHGDIKAVRSDTLSLLEPRFD